VTTALDCIRAGETARCGGDEYLTLLTGLKPHRAADGGTGAAEGDGPGDHRRHDHARLPGAGAPRPDCAPGSRSPLASLQCGRWMFSRYGRGDRAGGFTCGECWRSPFEGFARAASWGFAPAARGPDGRSRGVRYGSIGGTNSAGPLQAFAPPNWRHVLQLGQENVPARLHWLPDGWILLILEAAVGEPPVIPQLGGDAA